MQKISFCTVCMNRLYHLKKTLSENINDNLTYPELEILILDYNSSDGLEEWMHQEMKAYINSGLLSYYRTAEPEYFKRSHSRNMAFRLAGNSIICNVDADNYTGKDFAFYINEHFEANTDGFLSVDYAERHFKFTGSLGRIVCRKSDFEELEGYDEKMEGYGYEDLDFIYRLKKSGKKPYFLKDKKFLNSISHSHYTRQENEEKNKLIDRIYINYISPFRSQVLYLLSDKIFYFGTLIDNRKGFGNPSIAEKMWISGKWHQETDKIFLNDRSEFNKSFKIIMDGNIIDIDNNIFYLIRDESFNQKMKMNFSIITNHQHFLNNREKDLISVNNGHYGQGKVIKNFNQIIILD